MNPVIAALRENIGRQNVFFVFPSQVASDLWARKTCTLGIARSVAARRFLAWDSFKEEVIREKEIKRQAATSVMRKLFAHALIEKNSSGPFLKSLIPPEHAKNSAVFAPFIARLLPSLGHWEKLIKGRGCRDGYARRDAEDEDYENVKKQYADFLERHGLFEPSWEEVKIKEGSLRYVIFFPELIEDFGEYDALLTEPRFTRVKANAAQAERRLFFYQSARQEIRAAVMELRRLHEEEGIPYQDMAVSVPELREMEPWLLREFSLRQVPFIRRAGRKLGESGAGRLFSLINECVSQNFSFNKLKALILNDHIPWKETEKNRALVSFGISHNCVCSYVQNGSSVDIWEEAFKGSGKEGRELGPYYRDLKRRLLALAGSKNFPEIRKQYFAFRNGFLKMEKISKEDDAVLSRCIEELASLIALEEKLNEAELTPASPFSFFISCLGEKEYVPANQKPGVNIFKWRVAAASPFACHFVLNASQNAAAVLYQPMKFLRQDKRKALGLEDSDASWAFFLLCDSGEDHAFKSRCRISASAQSFSGWAIPHSFFHGNTDDPPADGPDPYREERSFWREGAELKKIFPLQKHSFESWKNTLAQKENDFSFFYSPLPLGAQDKIAELFNRAIVNEENRIRISPTTDLNLFYSCPLLWLFKKVFAAEEFSLEASLLDDTALGILYHKILESLFDKIKKEDGAFNSRRLDIYKSWTLEITRAAIAAHPAFRGPLAVPLVSPQALGISKKIAALLELEAKHFDGYTVAELELPVSFNAGELLVKGVIDRVSISPQGMPVIVDYKSNYLPEQTAAKDLDDYCLSEFQMPIYIKLYEEKSAEKTGGAFFYSIKGRKIKTVMGEKTGSRSSFPSRSEYEIFLNAAEKQIAEFGQKLRALDFSPQEIDFSSCLDCTYKTVCRTTYFLNSSRPVQKGEGQ
ncbi:MAG: PD-(D/E)XK nuclease family protein [Treponema sp.]|nr:PD-(D/E)XK nuclease family protein [Treponema sp.]